MNTKILEKVLTNRLIYYDITNKIIKDGDIIFNYNTDIPVFAIAEYGFSNKEHGQITKEIKYPCIIFHTYNLKNIDFRDDDIVKIYDTEKFVSRVFFDSYGLKYNENIEDKKFNLKALIINLDILNDRVNKEDINEFIKIKKDILYKNNHRYPIYKQCIGDEIKEC